jgi:UDP-2-acetamido-3-amino-2,3-dideoxy-glucuronate N-acetyltransferase
VTLEDDVFCGPSMVFTNVYNPRSAVARKDEYRRTLVKRGATLGANCTIVCGVTVGRICLRRRRRGGQPRRARLRADARRAGAAGIGWMSRFGERLDLPLRAGRGRLPGTPATATASTAIACNSLS